MHHDLPAGRGHEQPVDPPAPSAPRNVPNAADRSPVLFKDTAPKPGSPRPATADHVTITHANADGATRQATDAVSMPPVLPAPFGFNGSVDQLVSTLAYSQTRRLAFLRRLRGETQAVADWLSVHSPDERTLVSRLRDCASAVQFTGREDGSVRITRLFTCKQTLLCPLCASLRAGRQANKYAGRIVDALDADRTLVPYLVTLTVRAGEDLRKTLYHLQQCVRSFHARAKEYRRGRRGWTEAARIAGAVGAVDLNWCDPETQSDGNAITFHPHVHEIWLCSTPPDVRALEREWREITRDSFRVHVEPICAADLPGTADQRRDRLAEEVRRACRYAVRPGQNATSVRWHAYQALKAGGRPMPRLINSRGILRGQADEDEPGDTAEPLVWSEYRWDASACDFGEPLVTDAGPDGSLTLCQQPARPCTPPPSQGVDADGEGSP